ncbi:MAG: hypothetical protein JWM85_1289 [Acidimicrobiaceae bacterium]|nr:hypothetical protein [Acidimicrobiaceae bacterium]
MTRSGAGALVLGALLLGVGAALHWAAVAALGASLLLATLVAALSVLRRPHVHITRQIEPPRVSKGLPAIAYLQFTNRGRLRSPAMVALQPYGERSVPLVMPRLLRGQSGMRTYRLPTSRRGVFSLGPLQVTRADPFDLVRVTERHGESEEIWVSPKILPLRPLASGVTRNLEGPTSDRSPQGTITFHGLREYQVGDDLRMIHWKSTARAGQLMVRHNVDTSQPYTVVLLDLRPAPYSPDSFETAVDVAASVITSASGGKSPVQLRTTAGRRVGGQDHRGIEELLDHLVAVGPEAGGSIAGELGQLRRERGGTALVVVTGALDPEDLPQVAALRNRFEQLVVVTVSPDEREPVFHPGVSVVSGTDEETLTSAWNLAAGR